ncbi:MAG: O-antigen ligase family protein [Clostridiales Family XIII bacterium]|jgi:hypothetical protein|nr:O-antigen ligase family protein [Clostridiales Family XIII bacterium]
MAKASKTISVDGGYAWSMGYAPGPDAGAHWAQLLPAALFTAIVITLVRMYSYTRDMSQFYWSSSTGDLPEFFSHYKVVMIVVSVVLALLMLLYRVFTQSLAFRRSVLYYPMLAYSALVIISYALADEDAKIFAWHGWNDRFEGTYVLLCYMIMLFYIMNSVNSEKNVKWIIYPTAVVSALLSLLGLSQYLDRDFFRTALGQKLLVPNTVTEGGATTWDLIDQAAANGEQMLNFTFQHREIYQTVYNINYVSFYLTLLIPLFGLIFIREKRLRQKLLWGALFALVMLNLIGSASSGGILGMFFVVLLGAIMLNRRLLLWWRPLLVLIAITVAVAGGTYERWYPEVSGAVRGALGQGAIGAVPATPGPGSDGEAAQEAPEAAPRLDYFINEGRDIVFSVNGSEARVSPDEEGGTYSMLVRDSEGKALTLREDPVQMSDEEGAEPNLAYAIDDGRFAGLRLVPASPPENDGTGASIYYIFLLEGDSRQWPFAITDGGSFYLNDLGNLVKLENVPHVGWSDNPGFGSGRGYIWSRTLPMMKDTLLIGHGADTYCMYFPHLDYVGKHNTGWNINMIVDKPHNMYMAAAIGTGGLSLLALLALFAIYVVQSARLYWRESYDDFIPVVGVGIFLGVFGFLVSGFVDDSTVSVMPLFYGLLGVGIAINMMLARRARAAALGGDEGGPEADAKASGAAKGGKPGKGGRGGKGGKGARRK